VAFPAGQPRGILCDDFTIHKCEVKKVHPDKQTTPSKLSAVSTERWPDAADWERGWIAPQG